MENEKLQILNMIQDGKITADEGAKLLEAIESNEEIRFNLDKTKAKWIRVKVFDPEDETRVNIKLPISLVNLGVKLGSKFSPEFRQTGLTEGDVENIFNAIKNDETGKIIDIDSENGEKVEVIIE